MSFNYTSPSGIRLKTAEEPLLESIDNFNHPLNGCANLGDLHRQLNGDGVVLSDQTPMVNRQFNISEQERNEIMDTLKVRIDELNKSIANKSEELDVARNSRNWDLAHILGKEIEELGRQRRVVSDQFDIFKKAEPHNGSYLVQASVLILGKYDSFTKEVVLYRKSISSKNLLAIVYVHEMMHAYLDCGGITLPEIEEPIVEYAVLNFFNAFDNSICFEAKNHVKEKQQVIGIAHYGFGYCIFKNPNGINWLEDYRNAKISLVETDPNVAAYLDYWKTGIYPGKKEKECLEALYKALHHGSFKEMKLQSVSKNEQSKNKIDLIRKLDDYLAKYSPIAPLGNAVIPSNHENRLYKGWKDSSARQYFDWLDPDKHSELIPLLNKHGLYDSIYNCVDLQQIANIYKELVDKTTPEAIAAYGNSENMVSAIRHFIEHLLEINHIIL